MASHYVSLTTISAALREGDGDVDSGSNSLAGIRLGYSVWNIDNNYIFCAVVWSEFRE